MSKNIVKSSGLSESNLLTPAFASYSETKSYLTSNPRLWELYSQLPEQMQRDLMDFCIGNKGLSITYDAVFRRIFNPDLHADRLESLLSAILDRPVKIIAILPREGSQLVERGSFVIMDILVQLDDGSYANVEMQKIGYHFPLSRADCYAADVIMRQYSKLKAKLGKNFDFQNLQKIYCIILMEQSPKEFHSVPGTYIHKRTSSFDTGIFKDNPGLHEDIFICLDNFREIVHTITKDSSTKEAWMTFLSSTDIHMIQDLITAFPFFAAIYQELTDFVRDPEALMDMFSEGLYLMDRHMEKMMVVELQEEVKALKETLEEEKASAEKMLSSTKKALSSTEEELSSTKGKLSALQIEKDVFKLSAKGFSPEEIATQLNLPFEKLNEILNS